MTENRPAQVFGVSSQPKSGSTELSCTAHLDTGNKANVGNFGNGIGAAPIAESGLTKGQQYHLARTLKAGLQKIADLGARLELQEEIIIRGQDLYKKVQNDKHFRRRLNDAKYAACLYISCRQEGRPQSVREIGKCCNESNKKIARCVKSCLKVLNISLGFVTPNDFIQRFCSNLGLPTNVEACAKHIANKAVILKVAFNRTPISIAAAAIYMASQASSNNKRTQKQVAEVAHIVHSTIYKTYMEMYPHEAELFPDNSQ